MLERKRATQLQLIVTRDTGVVKARTIIDGVTVSSLVIGANSILKDLNLNCTPKCFLNEVTIVTFRISVFRRTNLRTAARLPHVLA